MRKSTNDFYYDTIGSNYSKSFILRGTSLLSQSKLKTVYLSKNHHLIINENNILLSIDIVPPNKNIDQNSIEKYKFLLNNPNDIDSQSTNDILIHHFTSDVVNVQMVNDILFVTESRGDMTCWFWNNESYNFDRNISLKLGNVESSKIVYSCVLDRNIFWIQKDNSSLQTNNYNLWFAELEIDMDKLYSNKEYKSSIQMRNITNIATLESLPENVYISPRNEGIWVIFKNSIHYYSIYERWDEISLLTFGQYYTCHHSITRELILINEKGEIHVATVKKGQYCITLKYLSTLKDLSYNNMLTKPFIYQHSIAFIYDDTTMLYNIQSGIKLSSIETPKGKDVQNILMLTTGDQPNGIIRDNNIYILKSPHLSEYEKSIKTKQLEGELNQNLDDIQLLLHSIQRSKNWNLDLIESKFLLDLISILSNFNSSDKNSFDKDLKVFIKSCENLMKHLQNPLILIPILHASKIPKKYIDEIVNNFLSHIQESKNDVIRTQYMQSLKWYTPMNLSLESLAYSYLKSNVDIRINPKNYTIDEIINSINSNDLEMLPSARIYQFIEYSPLKMMDLIEKFMGVPHEHLENISLDMKNEINAKERYFNFSSVIPASLNEILYRSATDSKNLYFEMLCHIYFYYKISIFIPFVFLVVESYKNYLSRKNVNIDAGSFYNRALNVIPLSSNGLNEEQLVSKYILLDRTGHHSISLKTMLQNDHWDWAVGYIKSKISKGDNIVHAELFTCALLHALDEKHRHKLSDIQNLVPHKISSSDFVTSLRIYSENCKTKKLKLDLFCDNENEIPMSEIKGILIKIINNESK